VFVRNATVGNNVVIRSVVRTLQPGDSILTLSVAYGEQLELLDVVGRMPHSRRLMVFMA